MSRNEHQYLHSRLIGITSLKIGYKLGIKLIILFLNLCIHFFRQISSKNINTPQLASFSRHDFFTFSKQAEDKAQTDNAKPEETTKDSLNQLEELTKNLEELSKQREELNV